MCDQQRFRPAYAYAQSDQSLCLSHEYSLTLKLLTGHDLDLLSFKWGCTGLYESTLVKMPHCWKSHARAQIQVCVSWMPKFGELLFSTLQVLTSVPIGVSTQLQSSGLVTHENSTFRNLALAVSGPFMA